MVARGLGEGGMENYYLGYRVSFLQDGFQLFLLPCCVACGILVPQSGTEPRTIAVKARSPNHWITRAFPCLQDEKSFGNGWW